MLATELLLDENESVVDEGVSRYGLHRLHVVRMGEAVELEKWAWAVEGKVETWLMYEEEELDVHHLRLYWRSPSPPAPLPQVGEGRDSKKGDKDG